jgi:hypothetical protein
MSIPILSRVTRTFLPAGFSRKFLCPDVPQQALRVASPHPFPTAAKSRAPGLGPALRCRGFGSFYGILRVFAVSEAPGIRPAVDSFPFSPPESAPASLASRVAAFAMLVIETIGPFSQFTGSAGKPIRFSYQQASEFSGSAKVSAVDGYNPHRFEQILRRSKLATSMNRLTRTGPINTGLDALRKCTGYDARVHKLSLFTLACFMIVMGACHSTEDSGACTPISGATRVVVHSWSQGTPALDYVITDAGRVHDLIAFANARREVSRPSLYTMPAPQITGAFYHGTDFVSAIGAGSNFFFVSCPSWKGVREATPAEIGDFKRLIGRAGEKPTQR